MKDHTEVQEPKRYTYWIDRKISVWERETFTTTIKPDDLIANFDKQNIEEYPFMGTPTSDKNSDSEFENLDYTYEQLIPEDNNYEQTIEIYLEEGGDDERIWYNTQQIES